MTSPVEKDAQEYRASIREERIAGDAVTIARENLKQAEERLRNARQLMSARATDLLDAGQEEPENGR